MASLGADFYARLLLAWHARVSIPKRRENLQEDPEHEALVRSLAALNPREPSAQIAIAHAHLYGPLQWANNYLIGVDFWSEVASERLPPWTNLFTRTVGDVARKLWALAAPNSQPFRRPGLPPRPLTAVESDIRAWRSRSTQDFANRSRIEVLKYISPRFLRAFLGDKRMAISATPGFTWGDGVYAIPLDFPYSTLMYGRAGIMGILPWDNSRKAYNATGTGLDLYQEWIQYFRGPYRYLTATIHANLANRALRNAFRRKFEIDLVSFPPDQFNHPYVNPVRDRWFVISDWSNLGPQAPGQKPAKSTAVVDCEWVAIVEEEFEESTFKTHFVDLFGPALKSGGPLKGTLANDLRQAYVQIRSGSGKPVRIEVS